MLSAMFSGNFPIVKDEDGTIFIDRNPTFFGYILDWMRSGNLPRVRDEEEMESLLEEAKYYQVHIPFHKVPTPEKEEKVYIIDDKGNSKFSFFPSNTYVSQGFVRLNFQKLGVDPKDFDKKSGIVSLEEVLTILSMPTINSKVLVALEVDVSNYELRIFLESPQSKWLLRTAGKSNAPPYTEFLERLIFSGFKMIQKRDMYYYVVANWNCDRDADKI
jgi:hypothetical protein